MTPLDFSGLASMSFSFVLWVPGLNNGVPLPSKTGATQMAYSSIRLCCASDAVSLALPKMNMFLPGCCFSLATSFSACSFTSLVLFQSAFFSVLEKTILDALFMKSAILSFEEGQKPAMPSYVTRPNKSMSVDFDRSREYRSSSSPQTESCQSMSQLFGPSKKPSSVTKFHMMSLLMSDSPARDRRYSIRLMPGLAVAHVVVFR